jgi:hypothetical protein
MFSQWIVKTQVDQRISLQFLLLSAVPPPSTGTNSHSLIIVAFVFRFRIKTSFVRQEIFNSILFLCSSPVVLSSSNGRSSDEGQEGQDGGSSSSNSHHRYKFKNNIKQRFNADLHDKPEDGSGSSKHSRKHATKASLKQTEHTESHQDGTMNSDMEDDEAMKRRNSSPLEILEDECKSRKSFSASTRRGSMSQTPSAPTASAAIQTTSTCCPNSSHVTPDLKTIAVSTGNIAAADNSELDIKLSREELLAKSLIPIIDKCPIPLILGDTAGAPAPRLAKNVGVPAFALHEKGLYYVPLTIDKSILSPYLAKLEPNISPPLHPVTISVCFLLSTADSKIQMDPDLKDLSPVLPLSTKLTKVAHELTAAAVPVTLPFVAAAPTTIKVPKSSGNINRETANNFVINRFSQSRQFSPASYRYPLPASSLSNLGGSHSGSQSGSSFHSSYHPPYYMAAPLDAHPTVGHGHSLLPAHITAGYGSSSSSSGSSSGGNPGRANRKRAVSNISPLSGTSSLGYHSMHDKYAPNTPDFYSYPSNTHSSNSSTTHSHIHSSSGSSNATNHSHIHSSSGSSNATNHSHIHSSSGSSNATNHSHIHSSSGSSNATNHSHIHSSSGSSNASSSNYHHHLSGQSYGFSGHSGSSSSSSVGHIRSIHGNDKIIPPGSPSAMELERSRRSCSPNKRVKRSRDAVDEVLKPKPLPIGLPIIPLPHNQSV